MVYLSFEGPFEQALSQSNNAENLEATTPKIAGVVAVLRETNALILAEASLRTGCEVY